MFWGVVFAALERSQTPLNAPPTPTFLGSADSTVGLSPTISELLILLGLLRRFVDLLILREIQLGIATGDGGLLNVCEIGSAEFMRVQTFSGMFRR